MATADLAERLVAAHFRRDIEQAEAVDGAGRAFDTLRIGESSPQHLIAGAYAEEMPAAAKMTGDIDVPTFGPQLGKIGDGGFRTGEDNELGIPWNRAAGPNQIETDVRLADKGIEIVEVGDAGQPGYGDLDGAAADRRSRTVQRLGVLCRQSACRRKEGDDPD